MGLLGLLLVSEVRNGKDAFIFEVQTFCESYF